MSDEDDTALRRKLERAVAAMPRIQRDILLAVRLHDCSYADIAELTGLTARRVERHFARALYKLDKQLNGEALSWWERWF